MQSKRWDADLVARARNRGDEKLRGRNVEEYGGVKGSFACVQAASPHAQPLLCLETSFFPFPPLTTPYQVEGSIFTPSPKGICVYIKRVENSSSYSFMQHPSIRRIFLFISRQPVFQDRMIKGSALTG